MQTWIIPISLLVVATLVAIPLSRYCAWIMEGNYRAPRLLKWFESRLDSGPQTWKQYAAALIIFNLALFVYGFAVLALQPWLPLNGDHKGMLAPSTIFNSVISFMTNTNLQHYAGEVNLSIFSQIFFCIANMFMSASVGFCSLAAMIRAFRGEALVGNFFVDMWRVMIYMFVPVSLVLGILFLTQGSPMTFSSSHGVTTLEAAHQAISMGPVAALEPIKMLGTNGGGFFGMNAAHPFENPTGLSNFFNTLAMMIFPFALVLMYGRMLKRRKHSWVVFSVMMALMVGTVVWSVYFDTQKPNPAFTTHPVSRSYAIHNSSAPDGKTLVQLPAVAGLPVDQHLGNLEGKELRFGTSAGATYARLTPSPHLPRWPACGLIAYSAGKGLA
jgi:K+-transporting ATPase ATPase A chain